MDAAHVGLLLGLASPGFLIAQKPTCLVIGSGRAGDSSAVAVKCIRHDDDAVARSRAAREQLLAVWASALGIGARVRDVKEVPNFSCILMDMAMLDLSKMARCGLGVPFADVQRAWSDAFELVGPASPLCRRKRLVCSDLKAANFLVYKNETGSLPGYRVKLGDFDPRFWSKAGSSREAGTFNQFVLMANTLLLTERAVWSYLPPVAGVLLKHAVLRRPSLISVLAARPSMLRKGPLHYAVKRGHAPVDSREDPLSELLRALEAAAKLHRIKL